MEFRFNLNEIFEEPIVEIGSSLIPPKFSGDKRALWDTQSKITQIVNAMGEASAAAQGLSKPITTADRLRNSEHKLYLLIDQSANNGKGAVTGMLKTGEKGLYVFDREGQHYQVSPPCVLDFYVHESRQRSGFGKSLFEHMLQKQQIEPVKMAIDRPSDKLLGFLNKHYGLNSPVKQMNNYVVYDGFFPKSAETPRTVDADQSYTPGKKQSANGLQHGTPSSPYGRYGAPRPPCSMGQIIHNDSAVIKRNQEPAGVRSEPITSVQGQQNIYNSNQIPAWQTTQSVPNMNNRYVQSQQSYFQNQQQHAQNQQYAQNAQHQQMTQYPLSSGDYQVNATSQNLGQQSAVQGGSDEYNQQVLQDSYNYTMSQGDATSQSYKDQNEISPALQQQMQQQQNVQTNSLAEQMQQPAAENQVVVQNQPQIFAYQGQNYFYNPQTQQYHMISDQYQQNVTAQNSQTYYNQIPAEVRNQPSHQAAQVQPHILLQKRKEPLRPQNLDGTVRKVQQSVSMPIRKMQEAQDVPVMVQGTASAPVNYQHQQVLAGHQPGAYNATPIQNEYVKQLPLANQINPARNEMSQLTLQHQSPNQPHNHMLLQNQSQHQLDTSVTPQNQLNNQMLLQNQSQTQQNQPQSQQEQPHHQENQPLNQQNQSSTQTTHQNQPNQMTLPNHPISQMVNLPSAGDQNLSQNQSILNAVPQNFGANTYQGENLRQNNAVMQPINAAPSSNANQMIVQAPGANQHCQMMPTQNIQQVPQAATMAPNTYLQNQQQNLAHQISNSQQVVNANINDNLAIAEKQPSHSAPNVRNKVGQDVRYARQNEEVDLSKGYPPQHHEIPAQQNSTTKPDRPQSLNIEIADDLEQKSNGKNDAYVITHGTLDGDSLDGDPATLEAIEQEIEQIEIAPKEGTPVSRGSKSPGLEAAGIVTPGRSTPGLTEQGYFDLKFYHNKLW